MARSMLAAIRAAVSVRADEEEIPETGTTGAEAPLDNQETDMSAQQRPAEAGSITQADHEAAVAAAETRGREAGSTTQLDRLEAAMTAEGIRGDGNRMAAAFDLARKSPAMSGADVAAFVVANVAATAAKPATETQAAHDQRVAAAGLALPNPPAAPGAAEAKAGWDAAFKRTSAS